MKLLDPELMAVPEAVCADCKFAGRSCSQDPRQREICADSKCGDAYLEDLVASPASAPVANPKPGAADLCDCCEGKHEHTDLDPLAHEPWCAWVAYLQEEGKE